MSVKSQLTSRFWRPFFQFVFGSTALALLTYACFQLDVNSTTVALLYLLVIVLVSLSGGIIPSIIVSIVAYLLLDSFFTAPLFRPAMNQPLDLVAPVAYLTTALIINRLMTRMRRSIENQKLAEERLRRSQAELAHVARTLTMGELTASIAHEINQPLSAIVTNASACLRWLAASPPNVAEANEAAQRIIRDGNRASEIITRIRAFLRKTDSEKIRLDINEIVHEVVILMANEIKEAGVLLRLKLTPDLPPVRGDRVQLQQVILNLIINGIEAMATLTNHPRELLIESTQQGGDQVVVIVRDTGAGIDPLQIDKIFDPFYSTKEQGMGMGLAISRSIIEDHGGRLSAHSDGGDGSTFQFTVLKYQ